MRVLGYSQPIRTPRFSFVISGSGGMTDDQLTIHANEPSEYNGTTEVSGWWWYWESPTSPCKLGWSCDLTYSIAWVLCYGSKMCVRGVHIVFNLAHLHKMGLLNTTTTDKRDVYISSTATMNSRTATPLVQYEKMRLNCLWMRLYWFRGIGTGWFEVTKNANSEIQNAPIELKLD